jgi:putative flippase GtrA
VTEPASTTHRLYMMLPAFVRNILAMEFTRYFISGCIAFVCDFTVLVVTTEVFGVHYLISNIAGYAVGLIVSYTINIKWVFSHRRFESTQGHEFLYFTIIVFVGLGLSELVMYVATETANLHYTWSKVVSTLFVFIFNYVTKKYLLFSPASTQSKS